MPDGIDLKRIINLYPETTVTDDDYTIVDSVNGGVKKFALGQALNDLKEDLSSVENNILTDDIKQALLQIAEKVAYIDEDGQDYYDALETALYPPADLVSISCVYTQSGTVYDTDTLDSLKPDLVVTALYDDQTTATVTTYTLSGTLTEGTSTITVSYGGKTASFAVTVSEAPSPSEMWESGVAYTPTVIQNNYINENTGAIESYSGWDWTGYLPCKGATIVVPSAINEGTAGGKYNAFFDEEYNVVEPSVQVSKTSAIPIYVPEDASYVGFSSIRSAISTCIANGITPYLTTGTSDMTAWANGIKYTNIEVVQNSYCAANTGVITPYNGWDRTGYMPCDGATRILFPPVPQNAGDPESNCFYDSNHGYVGKFTLSKTKSTYINVPSGAYYFMISSERAALSSALTGDIVPLAIPT